MVRITAGDSHSHGRDTEETIAWCESIIDLIDELPERAYEFAESVGEKVRSIMETIEESGRVTEGQITALENIESGVSRWFR